MRHWRRGLAAVPALAFVAGGIIIWPPAWHAIQSRPPEQILEEFERKPSSRLASDLGHVLDEQRVEEELGNRILTALCKPTVHTWQAYSAERPMYFSVTQPASATVPNARLTTAYHVKGPDNQHSGHGVGGNSVAQERPIVYKIPSPPSQPGTYIVRFMRSYEIAPRKFRVQYWWLPPFAWVPQRHADFGREVAGPPHYSCSFHFDIPIHVVESSEVPIRLVTDEKLDDAMRQAVTVLTPGYRGSYGTTAGGRDWKSSISFQFGRTPLPAAFRVRFVRDTGEEWVIPEGWCVYQDSFAALYPQIGLLRLQEPGHYAGTLYLEPDVELAYRDPTMGTIWGGTLEFPFEFDIMLEEASK